MVHPATCGVKTAHPRSRLAHPQAEVYKGIMAGRDGRRRSVLKMRTVAGQVFLLQVAIVVLIVAAASVALVLQGRADSEREARNRSVAVAETFANSPGIQAALKNPNPAEVLRRPAELARERSGVDFIVVINTKESATPTRFPTGSARSSSAISSPPCKGVS